VAYRRRLYKVQPTPHEFRVEVFGSLVPVSIFAISIPIAYTFGSNVALFSWLLLNYPIQAKIARVVSGFLPP